MKRVFDFLAAVCFLIILSPLFLLIALLIFFCDGRPIFFCQLRSGFQGKTFIIYKFKTMLNDCGRNGQLLPAEKRISRLGNFLRKTSLDELPQLFNVLKGDLSLVGPRPLISEYLPLYSKEQARRLLVRPGITGLAQVKGRNGLSWEERFKLDVWYVDHQTWHLDFKILLLTCRKILRGEDVSPQDGGIMPKFKGSHVEDK